MTTRPLPDPPDDAGPDWNPGPAPVPGDDDYVVPLGGDPSDLNPPTTYTGWDELVLQFGWLDQDALNVYLDAFFELGDEQSAWESMRQDPRYETWFPGNTTDDGRPRYSEASYATVIRQYDDAFRGVGINPEVFRERYGDLIAGDVKPDELERDRLIPMHDRIIRGSDSIRRIYAEYYGIVMTDAALMAAAIDPEIGSAILEGRISVAEIGGEAAESGFNISAEFADSLVRSKNLTKAEADEMFQRAESVIPAINVLAARHADPDDDFSLEDFVSADLFADPAQRRKMNKLYAQELSTFTGGAQVDYMRTREGGIAGLAQR